MSQGKRLRIAFVTTQKLWHGGEHQAALLADGLAKRGHDCRILARQGSEFAQRMADRGFVVDTFRGRGRMPLAIWNVRRTLHAWQTDTVLMNDPHAVTTAGLASIGLDVRLRIAIRRVDFKLRNAARYRRLCDKIVCVSDAVKSACIESGLSEESLSVVPDGVDPYRMERGDRERGRRSLGLASDQRLLITIARLADHKGHRYLLDAIPNVLHKHPNCVFAFAGDGQLWEKLRAQARRLGIENNVLFLGYRDDIPDLIAAADYMVVPSHLEGLCSSIIDAMMSGLPVVATSAGGIRIFWEPVKASPRAVGLCLHAIRLD